MPILTLLLRLSTSAGPPLAPPLGSGDATVQSAVLGLLWRVVERALTSDMPLGVAMLLGAFVAGSMAGDVFVRWFWAETGDATPARVRVRDASRASRA